MVALQDVLAASFLVILGVICGMLLRPHLARQRETLAQVPESTNTDSIDPDSEEQVLTQRLEQAQMAETQAKSMFENLLANAHEGLIMAGEDGAVMRFNPGAERIFGRRRAAVVGQPVSGLFSDSFTEKFAQYFNIAAERDPGNSIVAVRYARGLKADGTELDLDLSISCVLTADANVAFLISLRPVEPKAAAELAEGVVRELKQSRDELKATRHRLNVAKLELTQITHAVSHDLRSPVVNMMGFAEHLDHLAKRLTSDPNLAKSTAVAELVDDEIPKTLDFMTRSGRKLCDRVEAFRELSRLGKLELEPEEVTVRSLLEMPLATVAGPDGHDQVVIEIPDDLKIEVDSDAVELICSELMANVYAHKHPKRPIALKITADEARDYITLAFADNGRGIPEACQEQVFQLFKVAYNADSSCRGRGLAYCTRLVARLGGELTLFSKEDVGSTFYLRLPRHAVTAMLEAA
ncbi:MAG: ATP-binding protein [Gammaproteobacteria bacterium]